MEEEASGGVIVCCNEEECPGKMGGVRLEGGRGGGGCPGRVVGQAQG